MQTQAPTHPSPSQLAEFAAGKMVDAQAEAVARHLDACGACSKIVHALPPDSLTGRLQEAQRVYLTRRSRGMAALPAGWAPSCRRKIRACPWMCLLS